MYFSKGNRKLSKGVLIWNLPRLTTCPGAGACKDWCYEIKIERMYKGARKCREKNFQDSKKVKFMMDVVHYLKKRKEKMVRIHECGDFYNQGYLDEWKAIASMCGDVTFYAYTKSFHLDLWRHLPSNFNIIQSTGSKWDHLIDPRRPTFKAMPKGVIPNKGEHVCLGNAHNQICGGSCTVCMKNHKAHVVAYIHP